MLNLYRSIFYVTDDFSKGDHQWSKHAGRKYKVINTAYNNNFVHYNGIKDFVKFDISALSEIKQLVQAWLSKLAICNLITLLIKHKDYRFALQFLHFTPVN